MPYRRVIALAALLLGGCSEAAVAQASMAQFAEYGVSGAAQAGRRCEPLAPSPAAQQSLEHFTIGIASEQARVRDAAYAELRQLLASGSGASHTLFRAVVLAALAEHRDLAPAASFALVERALAIRREADCLTIGHLAQLARAYERLGAARETIELYEEILQHTRAAGLAEEEAGVLYLLGRALDSAGERDGARARFREALERGKQTGKDSFKHFVPLTYQAPDPLRTVVSPGPRRVVNFNASRNLDAAAYCPTLRIAATAGGEGADRLQAWDVTTRAALWTVPLSGRHLTFSDDCVFLAVGGSQTRVIETKTGRIVTTIASGGPLDFTEDGRHLWIKHAIFETATGRLTGVAAGPEGPVPWFRVLAVDADRGIYAATGVSAGSVDLRRREDDAIVRSLATPNGARATAAAFSRDGARLLGGTARGDLRFWNALNAEHLADFSAGRAEVTQVTLSETGRTFGVVTKDAALLADIDHPEKTRLFGRERLKPQPLAVAATHGDGVGIAQGPGTGAEIVLFDQSEPVRLDSARSGIDAIAFSPNSKELLLARSGRVYALDFARGHMQRYTMPEGKVGHLLTAPDGITVFASRADDRSLFRLDRLTHSVTSLDTPHGSPLTSLQAVRQKDGASVHLLTSDGEGSAALWDPEAGTVVQRFAARDGVVNDITVAPDVVRVLTAGADGAVRLWQRGSSDSVVLHRYTGEALAVAFSADGTRALSCGQGNELDLWDLSARKRLKHWTAECYKAVAFSTDGKAIVTVGVTTATVIDVDDRRPPAVLAESYVSAFALAPGPDIVALETDGLHIGRFTERRDGTRVGLTKLAEEWAQDVDGVSLSADGHLLVVGRDSGTDEPSVVRVQDISRGRDVCEFRDRELLTKELRVSPEGSWVAVPFPNGPIGVWNARTCEPVARLTGHTQDVKALAFAADGRSLVSASEDGTTRLWDLARRREAGLLPGHAGKVVQAASSTDGRFVVTLGAVGDARVWDAAAGTQLHHLPLHGEFDMFDRTLAFLAQANQVIFTERTVSFDEDRWAEGSHFGIWDIEKGVEIESLPSNEYQYEIATHPLDARRFVAAQGGLQIWERQSTGPKAVLQVQGATIPHFSPDGRLLATSAEGGSVEVFDAVKLQLLFSIVVADGDRWTIIDPQGRFETASFDQSSLISWVLPTLPYRALPMEYFTRDYFEPNLVGKVLAGGLPAIAPPPVPSLARPVVTIESISPTSDNEAVVTVAVTMEPAQLVEGAARKNGVFDLRLFRDGRLVRTWGDPATGAIRLENGIGKVTFDRVQMVPASCGSTAEFSAYAFNADGVRSDIARRVVGPEARPGEGPCSRHAFVVTMGVNASENPVWDLQYAASDARRIAEVLQSRLRGVDGVVAIALVSERGTGAPKTATRDHLQDVLGCLATGACTSPRLRDIEGANSLRRAGPRDVIILTVSSHGHRDAAGRFYLFPSDIGEAAGPSPTQAVLDKAISMEMLRDWLLPIEAEIALVLDTCDARTLVDPGGFKPAPLLGRTFGQLAFDKGMKVLVATKAKEAAREDRGLRHGLLTYRLIVTGLQPDAGADRNPMNGSLSLSEWLRFAEGVLEPPGVDGSGAASDRRQESYLFDFGNWSPEVWLVPVVNSPG
jgi:WD40 repeat protein